MNESRTAPTSQHYWYVQITVIQYCKAEVINTVLVIKAKKVFLVSSPVEHLARHPFNGDSSTWDTSKVMDVPHSFNGDASKWDTSRVAHMGQMFEEAMSFNGDTSKWDASKTKSF